MQHKLGYAVVIAALLLIISFLSSATVYNYEKAAWKQEFNEYVQVYYGDGYESKLALAGLTSLPGSRDADLMAAAPKFSESGLYQSLQYATWLIFSIFVLLFGAFVYYSRKIMPQPVPAGHP